MVIRRMSVPVPGSCGAAQPASSRTAASAASTATARSASWIRRHTDEELADVPALEQPEEGPGRVLESVHDVLTVLQPPISHPSCGLREEVGYAVDVVGDDEASHRRPVDQDRAEVGPGRQLRGVVLRDQAADGNPRVDVD